MMGFSLGVIVLSGLIFSLAPALMVTRPNLVSALKNERVAVPGRGRRWELSRLLVSLQVGLSLALLVGAGLFTRSLQNLKAVDTGYRSDQIVTMALDPAQIGYKIAQLRDFYSDFEPTPGDVARGEGNNLHSQCADQRFVLTVWHRSSRLSASPRRRDGCPFQSDSTRNFSPPSYGLLAGREFGRPDSPESPKVAIVNNSLARYFFGMTIRSANASHWKTTKTSKSSV
jgi:hypothetical protein